MWGTKDTVDYGKLSVPRWEITMLKDTLTSGDTFRAIMQDVREHTGRYPSSVVLDH